jgi:hypothetical protein
MVKKLIVAAIMIAGSSASSMAQDAQKGTAVFNAHLHRNTLHPQSYPAYPPWQRPQARKDGSPRTHG